LETGSQIYFVFAIDIVTNMTNRLKSVTDYIILSTYFYLLTDI